GLEILAGAADGIAGSGDEQSGRQRQQCEQLFHRILLNRAPATNADPLIHVMSGPRFGSADLRRAENAASNGWRAVSCEDGLSINVEPGRAAGGGGGGASGLMFWIEGAGGEKVTIRTAHRDCAGSVQATRTFFRASHACSA